MIEGPEPDALSCATLTDALDRAADARAGVTFLDAREQAERVPWADVRRRARVVAGGLQARAVRPGDRVAIVLPTGPEFLDAFFGTLLAGAVPVPVYPPVRLGRLEEYHARTARMFERVAARVVLTDARVRRVLGEAVRRAPGVRHCVAVADLAAEPATARADVRVTARDLALIQFSSGSTAEPRPVALTHAGVLANVAAIGARIDADPRVDAGVSWLPLYHDMGLIGCLLLALYYAGPLTLLPPEVFLARPALWLRAIARTGATISAAPAFAFGLCLKRVRDEDLAGLDLARWRVALCGAEPITPAVLDRFAERFARHGFARAALTPVYGLSEAALAVTFTSPAEAFTTRVFDLAGSARELPSLGRPLAGTAASVRDPSGREVPDGDVGEVCVRGPSVMVGYFADAEATRRAFHGAWLRTGDLGLIHQGELYLTGRARDTIIVRGANHAPHEFEAAVEAVEGVRAGCVAAVALPATASSPEGLALLVERYPCPRGDAWLREAVVTRVLEATSVRPDRVELLAPGTLPRTSSGKLRRQEARARWLAGTLDAPAAVTPVRMVAAVVRSALGHLRVRVRRLAGG